MSAAHPTPRTDDAVVNINHLQEGPGEDMVPADFARTLERENVELRRLIDRGRDSTATELGLAKQLESMRDGAIKLLERAETAERQLAEARKDAEGMAKYLLSHCQPVVDGACKQCNPSGEYLIPDFICGYHVAAALKENGNG